MRQHDVASVDLGAEDESALDDTECFEVRAHASTDAPQAAYPVSTSPSVYVTFRTQVPWTGRKYITSMRPLVDNDEVLVQSWLYAESGKGPGVERSLGVHPSGELLVAWAPGTGPLALGPDVGMAYPEGNLLALEHHYDNTTGEPAPDASGVEICVTSRRPKHVVALSILGTMAVAGKEATGHCIPTAKEPIRLLHLAPMMRGRGRHARVTLHSADGSSRIILDDAYDFAARRWYPLDGVQVQPGDTLTTTCTYATTVRFGASTVNESCEVYAIHEPAGALVSSGIASLIYGRHVCMK